MSIDPEKGNKIKAAVRRNFDSSPVQYDEFEARHGFFKNLNSTLLKLLNTQNAKAILDIGCGTGASSAQMMEACPEALVFGVDNSSTMLEKARQNYGSTQRISFIEGDAAALTSCLDQHFDTIIYSASIFLIPDFRESLLQAYELLKPSGQIGLTFMDGVYSDSGENLFFQIEQQFGLGLSLKKPVALPDLEACLRSLFHSVSLQVAQFRLPKQQVKEFFSIPAMSAGLFPSVDYPNRLLKISALLNHIPEDELNFRWVMIVGSKS